MYPVAHARLGAVLACRVVFHRVLVCVCVPRVCVRRYGTARVATRVYVVAKRYIFWDHLYLLCTVRSRGVRPLLMHMAHVHVHAHAQSCHVLYLLCTILRNALCASTYATMQNGRRNQNDRSILYIRIYRKVCRQHDAPLPCCLASGPDCGWPHGTPSHLVRVHEL